MDLNITKDVESSANVNESPIINYRLAVNRNIDLESRRLESPETQVRHCAICLDPFIKESHTESCLHTFCFECLKRWSFINSRCPLCMAVFMTIVHSINNQGVCITYIVPERRTTITIGHFDHGFAELRPIVIDLNLVSETINFQYDTLMNSYDQNNIMFFPEDLRIPYRHHMVPIGHQRALIYRKNLWAEQLPNLRGQFRICSLNFYREDPTQVFSLSGFILNDVIAIRSIFYSEEVFNVDARATNIGITNTIMQTVFEHDLRSANMATSLRTHLGDYSYHFCHELFTYANSSYDMNGYYNIVQYHRLKSAPERVLSPEVVSPFSGYSRMLYTASSTQTAPIETITLDSDSDDSVTDQVQPTHDALMPILNHQNETVIMDSDSDDIVTDQTQY